MHVQCLALTGEQVLTFSVLEQVPHATLGYGYATRGYLYATRGYFYATRRYCYATRGYCYAHVGAAMLPVSTSMLHVGDRKSTRLNSSQSAKSRMPSSA